MECQESVFYLFKLLAYYGTEFTQRRNIEAIVEQCRAMRMTVSVPPTFDGLRELWDKISEQLDSVAEYRKPLQYKPLFYSSVRNSISDASFNQFFGIAEMLFVSSSAASSLRCDTDDECFRLYRGLVAEIAKTLNDSGANASLSYRGSGNRVKMMVARVQEPSTFTHEPRSGQAHHHSSHQSDSHSFSPNFD
jgi:hypothetical protein